MDPPAHKIGADSGHREMQRFETKEGSDYRILKLFLKKIITRKSVTNMSIARGRF